MRRVEQRGSKPEMIVRRALQAAGYRFRLHRKDMPGSPDIVFPARRAVVFVHGCFWHRHPGCRAASTPKTRASFWTKKFAANTARDARAIAELERQGWRVHVVWECGTKSGTYLQPLLCFLALCGAHAPPGAESRMRQSPATMSPLDQNATIPERSAGKSSAKLV
jgi:DNA mismatch endonuclease, patch repair protein